MAVDIRQRLDDLERRFERMIRIGKIATVNGDEITVTWPDGDESAAMPVIGSSSALALTPTVGDQVYVLAPGGDPELASALMGVSSTDAASGNKSKVPRTDSVKTELEKIADCLAGLKDSLGSAVVQTPGATYIKPGDIGDVGSNKATVD